MQKIANLKGFTYAAISSSTFGLAPFFSIRLVTDGGLWLDILGLGIVATAMSNMALVKSIKTVGPTLTSVLGAMEPLVAVMLGIICFGERLTAVGAAGIVLIVAGVTIVAVRGNRNGGR